MRNGNIVVKVETTNSQGEKVLDGTAEVAQPTTVYVFTGQGSQEPGMGITLLLLLVLFGMAPTLTFWPFMVFRSRK